MKKEIKFRAFVPSEKTMIGHREVIERTHYQFNDSLGDGNNDIIMQYSGLKDSNGVEIYEGDVVYLAGYGDYHVEFPFVELYEAAMENDIGAIKGNIHQNPELL